MGLNTSHGCFDGAYSSFMRWRTKICEVAGYGDIREREGFGGIKEWPENDILTILLYHSDCDGDIEWEACSVLARRLKELLPALKNSGDGGGHVGMYEEKTQTFIDGLLIAHKEKENVEFY